VPKELDGCQCFTLLISSLEDGYLPSFYARYLNAAAARGYFAVESWGSAQQNISVPILKELYVPRLPLDEQRVIVAECERVDAASQELASHVLKHISLLREYRSSLISAAVTGQLSSF
jgi:type I restriction enzyme S subunit